MSPATTSFTDKKRFYISSDPQLVLEQLLSATINITGLYEEEPSKVAVFNQGLFESATKSAGFIPESLRIHDIDGDGYQEAVLLIWENSRASGNFVYIVALSIQEISKHQNTYQWVQRTRPFFVGDRIIIESLELKNSHIFLRFLYAGINSQGAQEAFCCPGQRKEQIITLVKNDFTVQKEIALPEPNIDLLINKTWILQTIQAGPNSPRILPKASSDEVSFSIEFRNGQVAGKAVCNRWFSVINYLEGTSISFGKIASTRMYCENDDKILGEDQWFNYLSNVQSWDIYFGILRLHGNLTDFEYFSLHFIKLD